MPIMKKSALQAEKTMTDRGEFEIVPGPNPRTLRIIFRGFWIDETMDRYMAVLRQRADAAGGQTPVTKVLLDLQTCSIQSPALIGRMAELIARYAAQIEHYGMLLPESPLLALQMKKLMKGTPVSYFNTDADATIWLWS